MNGMYSLIGARDHSPIAKGFALDVDYIRFGQTPVAVVGKHTEPRRHTLPAPACGGADVSSFQTGVVERGTLGQPSRITGLRTPGREVQSLKNERELLRDRRPVGLVRLSDGEDAVLLARLGQDGRADPVRVHPMSPDREHHGCVYRKPRPH